MPVQRHNTIHSHVGCSLPGNATDPVSVVISIIIVETRA